MIGILAIVPFPHMAATKTDEVMPKMLAIIGSGSLFFRVVVAVLLLGAMAAIMSTADSVLLSLSSIVMHDLYGRTLGIGKSDKELMRIGKVSSWLLAALMLSLALGIQSKTTLYQLLELKFELLMQVAPAFILGFYTVKLRSGTALLAMVTGTAIAIAGFVLQQKWWGFHPGVIGCAVNFLICLAGCWRNHSKSK